MNAEGLDLGKVLAIVFMYYISETSRFFEKNDAKLESVQRDGRMRSKSTKNSCRNFSTSRKTRSLKFVIALAAVKKSI